MKVTYIDHCGYLIETEKSVLLFDYWKGEIPDFDQEKSVYVFVSHGHVDHYNKDIFKLRTQCSRVFFILSDDIQDVEDGEDILFVRHKRFYHVGDVDVTTYFSTDVGVAYGVSVDGYKILHMGDLNWWHWKKEDDVFNQMQERRYNKEIQRIAQESFDVVMGPAMDNRLEENYYLGMKTLLEQVEAKYVFPTHFWDDYALLQSFLDDGYAGDHEEQFMMLHDKGQVFEL